MIDAPKSDLYDVLTYIAYTTQPVTRAERVDSHRLLIFEGYADPQREFIDFVLNHYVEMGVDSLSLKSLSNLLAIKYGAPAAAAPHLGSSTEIRSLFEGFQQNLYVHNKIA